MIKEREGYRLVVLEPAKTWIEQNSCGGCGKPKKDWSRRKDWTCCSTECTERMREKFMYIVWADIRLKVFKRDHYTCVKCCYKEPTKQKMKSAHGTYVENVTPGSTLDADHIKPIALGGEEWDMRNLQTLCKPCHKIKTRGESKLFALERKIPLTQTRFQ